MPSNEIGPGGTEPRHAHREEVAATLPSQEDLFERLVNDLAESGEVEVVEPGVLRFVEGSDDGDAVEIHVTPAEWREYVIDCEMVAQEDSGVDAWGPGDGLGMALLFLDETIGPREGDERFVVFHRGEFERSVRSELPPIQGHEQMPPLHDGDYDWRT